MKILIVDDEAPARGRLRRLLDEIGDHQVVGEASNGREAVVRARELSVDLLLMDIRMPGMDGLDAAAELARFETPPAVIFTTAYDTHAIEAFERNAVDYLLKPVRRERLARALNKAAALTRPQMAAVERLREASGEFVEIAIRGGIKRIPLEGIAFFRADQKYVLVRHDDGEDLSDESLKALEERFGDWLLRIHRNTLIAVNRLEALEKGRGGENYARLRGLDDRLEVSRRHAAEVRRRLKG